MEVAIPMLHLRPSTLADIATLRALAQEIWRACYPGIISAGQIEYMLGWMYSAERIHRELSDGVCWEIAEIAGAPAAFLAYAAEPDGRVKLHKLYLLPQHHGLGLSRQLLAHVAEKARALGASEVWLQVNKRNSRAIAAYQRAGYRIASEATFDIGGGYVMDDYLMACAV